MTASKQHTDLTKTYTVNDITVKFDASAWAWIAINSYGFGIDSDDDLDTLLNRINN